jgi:hypothetical protein
MRLDELWASLFPASLPPTSGLAAGIVFLQSRVCCALLSASPHGYALRFATVTVIGSGWLLSSNKIPPRRARWGRFPICPQFFQTAPDTLRQNCANPRSGIGQTLKTTLFPPGSIRA